MEEEISLEKPVGETDSRHLRGGRMHSSEVEEKHKADYLKIGLLVLVGLVLLGGTGYAGYWYASQTVKELEVLIPTPYPIEAKPTPTPIPEQPTPTPIRDETADWKSHRNEEAETKYSFRYPEGWTISREHKDIEGETRQAYDTTTLTRNGYKIKITQAMGSSASCLYPEDPNKEGMYARYGDYVELAVGGKILRRAKSTGSLSNRYVFCEKKGAEFVGTTSFGIIYYEVPEEESATVLKEMDFIIKSLTLIE